METVAGQARHLAGVFKSDTKYRDIADGNISCPGTTTATLYVRYQVPRYSGWKQALLRFLIWLPALVSDTKYRDIADGNRDRRIRHCRSYQVRYQVPRYSGWKLTRLQAELLVKKSSDTKYRDIADGNHDMLMFEVSSPLPVRYQVPRYSGWKYTVESHLLFVDTICEPTGFLTRITNSSHNTAILIPLHSRQSS